MKHIYKFIVIVIAGLTLAATSSSAATIETPQELIIKTHMHLNSCTAEMVYDKVAKRISLRIPEGIGWTGPEISFLQRKVEIMTSKVGKKTRIADGYVLVYDGGYPIWGPYYQSRGGEPDFACLLFSEKVSFNGKEIHFAGELKKPKYYPYNQ